MRQWRFPHRTASLRSYRWRGNCSSSPPELAGHNSIATNTLLASCRSLGSSELRPYSIPPDCNKLSRPLIMVHNETEGSRMITVCLCCPSRFRSSVLLGKVWLSRPCAQWPTTCKQLLNLCLHTGVALESDGFPAPSWVQIESKGTTISVLKQLPRILCFEAAPTGYFICALYTLMPCGFSPAGKLTQHWLGWSLC